MIISKNIEKPNLRVLSLGAGVQSTVMALMTMTGEIKDKPDCAIFADTGAEPKNVYKHLEWLIKQLDYPVYIVSKGNLRDDTLSGFKTGNETHKFATIPFFLKDSGMGRRQCTADYKIMPVRKKTRELLGIKKHKKVPKDVVVETWIGISLDEMQRAKDSRDKWSYHRFPLLELELKRHELIKWFDERYPEQTLTKSSCTFCPFHDNTTWRNMKKNDKESWEDAVNFDKKLRERTSSFKHEQYVHRSCVPLDEVDFDNLEDKGQITFLDECEGMCGV
tara:strand:- start:490 stop:1320 length:831 start_codon:yes stop_codon:yes gene_type:complete